MALTPITFSAKFATDPAVLPWDTTPDAQLIPMSQDTGAGMQTVIGTLEDLQSLINLAFSGIPTSGQNIGRMVYVTDAFGAGKPGIAVFDSATTYKVFQPGIYDFGMFYPGTPDNTVLLMQRVIIAQPITIPANMAGAYGYVTTSPDATYDIDLQDDGVSIGTVSISNAGAFTFTTTGGTAKNVAPGSRLDFFAPTGSPTDASIEDISLTIAANSRMTG